MSRITRHFWGWDAPVLDKALAFLSARRPADTGAPDLADTLLIVPTAEAGRRLRESLARGWAATGLLSPVVWTAEQALLPPAARLGVASPLQSQLAWQQALQSLPPARLPALFPQPPEDNGWTWQVETARLLMELQSLMGAGGLGFAEVEAGHDAARWRDLAALAAAQAAVLADQGLEDAQTAKRRIAAAPVLPEGVTRVMILAAPDLPPLFDIWATACATRGVEVEVAVQASTGRADDFDALGRPRIEAWGEDAPVVLPFDDAALRLCHDATAQANQVITELRCLAPAGRVAVGVADPEVGAVLAEKLALEGVAVFEPGGLAAVQTGLWHLLSEWRSLLATGSWRSLTRLLRVPEMRAALAGTAAGGCDLLAEADAFAAEHLPVTLDHARELQAGTGGGRLGVVLATATELLAEWQQMPFAEAARAFLLRLYGTREFRPEAPEDHLVAAPAEAWLACCEQIGAEADRFGLKLSPEQALGLSLEALARTALAEPRGEVDLVLQGWLELLWEASPGLVIAGLNEEQVPGILLAHPFLPDSLRQRLGLPCQASRFARDAYLLGALAAPRAAHGGLRLLCGQWSERGDSLRPSRLLFLCSDADLPARVARLFPEDAESAPDQAEPPRSLAWKLRPHLAPPAVETISPSRLRSYLECPFRHYLTSELRLDATVDPDLREMDALAFGNLAHHALQQLALATDLRECTDAGRLADFLVAEALTQAQRIYGRRPAPLVSLQLEGLKQRLRHAALIEADDRAQGWRILHAEWAPDTPLIVEGAQVRLKIDRIDRHQSSGQIRVLDYKTSDKASAPLDAHAPKAPRALDEIQAWREFVACDGVRRRWVDLQLPLYAAALRLHGLEPQEAGYFVLPKSVQDTRVLLWPDFGKAWIEPALACAAEAVRRMRAGVFWPPSARAYDRGFDDLFLGDPGETVEFVAG
jgi:ATP-dependent helicase/nuclease subunit B